MYFRYVKRYVFKDLILAFMLGAVIVLIFWIGINKAIDSRCGYYAKLGMTQEMVGVCQ